MVRIEGFPDVSIQAPTKAAARYEVSRRGRAAGYFAKGFRDFLTRVRVARNLRAPTPAEAYEAAMRAITALASAAGDDGLMYAANRAWRELDQHHRRTSPPPPAPSAPVRQAAAADA